MKLSKLVNVIDVETTCWEPIESQPPNEVQEIIEIGIAVVDVDDLQIMEKHTFLVRPEHSSISQFCYELTGRHLNNEYPMRFHHAIEDLKKAFNVSERAFISWGDFDRIMFEKNCKLYNCKYPFGPRHLNLRYCFSLLNNLSKEPDLPTALSMVGCELVGRLHSGKDDAANIARVLIKTLEKMRK